MLDPDLKPCNIAAYLEEQERDCLRLANVTGTHTETGDQWTQIAYNLSRMKLVHAESCRKCKGKNS